MDLEVTTYQLTRNMAAHAIELCPIQIFSESMSYTPHMFQFNVEYNDKQPEISAVAIQAQDAGVAKWNIPYSDKNGLGTKNEVKVTKVDNYRTHKALGKPKDAPLDITIYKAGNNHIVMRPSCAKKGPVQPLMLSKTLMIRLLRQESELFKEAEKNLFLTYNWMQSDGPRLYTEVLSDKDTNMYKTNMVEVSNLNKDTFGLYDASISIDFTKTTQKGNLHFDFGKLVTTIPKSVYITLRERLREMKDITFQTDPMKSDRILFHCLKDEYD